MEVINFTDQFKEDYEKISLAVAVANRRLSREVVISLSSATIELGKIDSLLGDDDAVNSFLNFKNNISSAFKSLQDSALAYGKVEEMYEILDQQLNLLKNTEIDYQDCYKNEPHSTDSKYYTTVTNVMTGESEKKYNREKYNVDKTNWENDILQYELDCKKMVDNIIDIKQEIESIKNCDVYETTVDSFNNNFSIINIDTSKYNGLNQVIYLEGGELKHFLKEHEISGNVSVGKYEYYINGIPFTIFKVFDNDRTDRQHIRFERFVRESLQYEQVIDEAVLSVIKRGGTDLIFMENRNSVPTGKKEQNVMAYIQPFGNRDIVMLFPNGNGSWTNSTASIVHESGHAYDASKLSCLTGNNQATDFISISAMNKSQFQNGLKYNVGFMKWEKISPEDSSSLCVYGEDNTPYTWSELAQKEAQFFDYDVFSNEEGVTVVGGLESGYVVSDYTSMNDEYFADAFQAYYLGDKTPDGSMSRFEFQTPETYRAIDNIIQNEIKNYEGK